MKYAPGGHLLDVVFPKRGKSSFQGGAALFLLPCYGLWRLGMQRYQAAGS